MSDEKRFPVSNNVIKEFFNVDNVSDIVPFGGGHINRTFLVKFPTCSYILQRINIFVFENPFAVTNNINLITDHIRKNVIYEGKDPRACVLTPTLTRYGQVLAIVDDEYWRCNRFIEEGITYDESPNPSIFEEAGRAVGEFHRQLDNFNPTLLVDTIKHFHDTPYRYNHFLEVVNINRMKRASQCKEEIDYVNSHVSDMSIITSLLENHEIPVRVTHNDTKLNNIMISKTSHKALGMLDLDTVMKGSLLYDFGDALRIGASTAAEDETDLSKVKVDFVMFEAFVRGYLESIKSIITEQEVKHLVDSFFIMTLEVGLRFLTDFIDGDVYFQLNEEQRKNRKLVNLERAKCQLKLASEIENNREKLNNIVNNILEEFDYNVRL